jgi:hypothetical protein
MTIPGRQGLSAGLAVLIVAAASLAGCDTPPAAATATSCLQDGGAGSSGCDAGTAETGESAPRCLQDGGGVLQSPPSGPCSPVGLQCEVVDYYCPGRANLRSRYSCQCDLGTWSCTMTEASLDMCPPDSGPPDSGPADGGPADSGPPDSGPADADNTADRL